MKLRYYAPIRLIMAIPTILILMTTIFFMMRIIPGDPIRIMYGDEMPEEAIQRIRHEIGLDRPIYVQYLDYMNKFFRGDLGISLEHKTPVIQKIKEAYPVTIELTLGGIFLAVVFGVPLGVLAALKRGGKIDNIIRFFSLYIYSNPSFWLGLIFQLFFGVILSVLPLSGRSPATSTLHRVTGLLILDSILALDFHSLVQSLEYLILPCLTIGITRVPRLCRLSRAALLNELGEDYITTARAKGLPYRTVVYKHGLRNSLLPVITIMGGSFAGLLGGTVITEKIFSLPGLGRLLIDALGGRDFVMIQAIVGIYALVVVLVNTLVDLIYAAVDPRIKF